MTTTQALARSRRFITDEFEKQEARNRESMAAQGYDLEQIDDFLIEARWTNQRVIQESLEALQAWLHNEGVVQDG
jgi:hypothetical protein